LARQLTMSACLRGTCTSATFAAGKLLRTPIQLGGTDKVVQIDESVMVKAKYHHGHQLREKQRWVFGVYDPELKEGFIQLVEQRDAATLLPIIQRVVHYTASRPSRHNYLVPTSGQRTGSFRRSATHTRQ